MDYRFAQEKTFGPAHRLSLYRHDMLFKEKLPNNFDQIGFGKVRSLTGAKEIHDDKL